MIATVGRCPLLVLCITAFALPGCSTEDTSLEHAITRDGGPTDAAADGGEGPGMSGRNGLCPGQEAAIRGTVYAPNGIDPLPHATVYLAAQVPAAFPETVTCDACTETIAGATQRASHVAIDGAFSLAGICPGNQILVLENGRFRRVIELDVHPSQQLDLPAELTRMPRLSGERHRADNVPRIAVVAGTWDNMECVLRQMGLDARAIDIFGISSHRNSWFFSGGALPDFITLVRDLPRLKQYQILFFNCGMSSTANILVREPQIRQNLRDYVAGGGRLYVTDLAYDWIEQVEAFSPFIDFEPGPSGPEPEELAAANLGTRMDAIEGIVRDQDLARWLALFPGTINDDRVPLHEFITGWSIMHRVSSETKVWVEGPVASSQSEIHGNRPLTVGFTYQDCGKVLYTSYHTHGDVGGLGTFDGFPGYCAPQNSPQERILAYLIFDIARCIQPLL